MPSLSRSKRRLQGARYTSERFEKQDLRSASAYKSEWLDCTFSKCQMSLSDFSGAAFHSCTFVDCDLQLSSFQAATIRRTHFLSCNMEQTNLLATVFDEASFDSCRLAYSRFNGATIRSLISQGCNFHGADLNFIECNHAEWQDCNLWGVSVGLGCQFFNGQFDERTRKMFIAMAARAFPEGEERARLIEVAGKEYPLVCRLMEEEAAG